MTHTQAQALAAILIYSFWLGILLSGLIAFVVAYLWRRLL